MLCSLGPAAHVADCRQLTATSVAAWFTVWYTVHRTPYTVHSTPYTDPTAGNTKLPPLLRNPMLSPTLQLSPSVRMVRMVRVVRMVKMVRVVRMVAASSECSL